MCLNEVWNTAQGVSGWRRMWLLRCTFLVVLEFLSAPLIPHIILSDAHSQADLQLYLKQSPMLPRHIETPYRPVDKACQFHVFEVVSMLRLMKPQVWFPFVAVLLTCTLCYLHLWGT